MPAAGRRISNTGLRAGELFMSMVVCYSMYMKDNDKDRFLSKVSIPAPASSCWLWEASEKGRGYGGFWLDGKNHVAHKVSYETWVGSVPEGLELDHVCRNRDCVNPLHLEPVTRSENILRGLSPRLASDRARERHASRTHCKYGHEFTPENTKINFRDGFTVRSCRVCNRARKKACKLKARLA